MSGTLANLLNGKGINDTVRYGIIDSGGKKKRAGDIRKTDGQWIIRVAGHTDIYTSQWHVQGLCGT